jgi:hypothetical protein
VWSATPPRERFVRVAADATQAKIDAEPRREPAGLVDGTVTLEASSVVFNRDGTPALGIVTALTDSGRRAVANTRATGVMESLVREPWEGRRVRVTNDGSVNALSE